jgi:arginyl-tRNA synthetase
MIGVGAVKYHIVKMSASKPITFKWEEALSFDGDAAPYLQYAHARSCRILEKAGVDASKTKPEKLDYSKLTPEEKEVIKLLGSFPLVVEEAAQKLSPHTIANHLYALAAAYSRFYKNCQVIGDDGVIPHRLLLVDAARNTIKIGLNLLGIEAPDRM